MPVRFHLDEHISAAVAAGLRRRNIDVTTAAQEDLLGKDDLSQLAFAAKSGPVLVTQDADFLRLHAQGRDACGNRILSTRIDINWPDAAEIGIDTRSSIPCGYGG